MAEVLEIQIHDKGNAGGMSGPPRAPSAGVALEEGWRLIDKDLRLISNYFADLPEPAAPAASEVEKPAHAPTVARIASREPHAPASFGIPAEKRAATQAPHPPAMSREKPHAPSLAGVATRAGEAAEGAEAVAGEEAVGGALASLSAAALPVAAAFVAAEVAIQATTAAFDEAHEVVQFLGQQVNDMAHNSYWQMIEHRLEFTEKALSKLPVVGGLLGSAFGAAVAPVQAFTGAVQAFNQRAGELAGFSPDIALAQSRSEIRSLFDDIREADTLGPDMARMIDAQTTMQHDMREIFLPIKKIITELLANVLENATEYMPMVRDGMVTLLKVSEVIVEMLNQLTLHVLNGVAQPIEAGMEKAIQALKNIDFNTKKDRDAKEDPFLADLLKDKDWGFAAPADARPLDPRPNIPLVQPFAGL